MNPSTPIAPKEGQQAPKRPEIMGRQFTLDRKAMEYMSEMETYADHLEDTHARLLARCAELEVRLHAATHHADWNDRPDAYTAAIDAVHPMEGEFDPELYVKALSMVSNRHEKYNLVNLVHWLLKQAALALKPEAKQP